jgi:hypothetical protein
MLPIVLICVTKRKDAWYDILEIYTFAMGHIHVDVMNLFHVQLCIYIDVDCTLYHDSDM